jgi:hypothetical protein
MALIDKADQLYTHTNLDWDWSLQTSSHAATTLNTTTRLTASKSRSRPASVFRFKARDPARANCTWPAEHTSVLAFPSPGCFHRLQCSALRMHADAWLFLLDPIFEVCPALCTLHNHATPAHTCARPRCTTRLHPRIHALDHPRSFVAFRPGASAQRCFGRSSEQMLHAMRKHVQAMPRGTWTRPRAHWVALRAAARRQSRPLPPARAARPPRR